MNEALITKIGIIWLVTFIIGFAISLAENKKDIVPSYIKTYQINLLRNIAIINIPMNFLLIGIFAFGLGLIPTFMFFKGNLLLGFLGIVILISSVFFVYYSVLGILLHIQYYQFEKQRTLIFNPFLKTLSFINSITGKSLLVSQEDIKEIELNFSSGNQRKPTAEYEFIKLKTKKGDEFIITSLQTKILNLDNIFSGVKKKINYNKINWLK